MKSRSGQTPSLTCPTCKGAGTQTVTVQERGKPDTSFPMACTACAGVGKITPRRSRALQAEKAAWCSCATPGEAVYHADGESPACRKHHYTCRTCGKILQVG